MVARFWECKHALNTGGHKERVRGQKAALPVVSKQGVAAGTVVRAAVVFVWE